jgi:hypothetical protein
MIIHVNASYCIIAFWICRLFFDKNNFISLGHRIFVDHLLPESRALHLLIIKMLKSSGCGELEITDVNNVYISRDELTYDVLQGWWTDAGTHASLAKASKLAHDLFLGDEFSKFKM